MDQADTGFSGETAFGFGHAGGDLFVAGGDVANFFALIKERVYESDVGCTDYAIDSLGFGSL
jgi:hypothetical protein